MGEAMGAFEIGWRLGSLADELKRTIVQPSTIAYVLEGGTGRIIVAAVNSSTWDASTGELYHASQSVEPAILATWSYVGDQCIGTEEDVVLAIEIGNIIGHNRWFC